MESVASVYIALIPMYVIVSNMYSKPFTLASFKDIFSVPYYSLFISACNDVFGFVHYADFSTAAIDGYSLDDTCNLTNVELSKIDKWLCRNRLSLNVSKSTFMMISNNSNSNVPDIYMWGVK